MLTQLVARLGLLVAVLSTACAQQAPEQQKPAGNPNTQPQIAHSQPITEDLSQGGTFTFKIATNLPDFTLKVIPDVQKPDQYGNPTTIIRDVQVFVGASSQPLQSLEDCEWEGMEAPARGSDWFRAEDMNFDGYKDVYVLTNWGATAINSGVFGCTIHRTGVFGIAKNSATLAHLQSTPRPRPLPLTATVAWQGQFFERGNTS